MKVSERNSAEPGGKNSPFPAWVLRYASQPTGLATNDRVDLNLDLAEEQNYSELSHFEEAQPTEPADAETAVAVPVRNRP